MTEQGRILFSIDENSSIKTLDGSYLTVEGFTTEDLISFGEYLLSKHREESLKLTNELHPDSVPYEESHRFVYHADLQNWIDTQK